MGALLARELRLWAWLIAVTSMMATACSNTEPQEGEGPASPDSGSAVGANIVAVRTSGSPGAYNFAVTLQSPDTGCDRYADWWEVITPDGELLYRRVLAHSHVNEQPFTRGGGPVDVEATTQVIVRAHMNDAGYGGVAFGGSVEAGFAADASVAAQLAPQLAEQAPLPNGCAF
jgi:hypothetical protein